MLLGIENLDGPARFRHAKLEFPTSFCLVEDFGSVLPGPQHSFRSDEHEAGPFVQEKI